MKKKVSKLLSLSLITTAWNSYLFNVHSNQSKYNKAEKIDYVKKAWQDTGSNIEQAMRQYEREFK